MERMKRAVEAHPWVRSAEVTRSFPRTVEIRVVEHEPRVLVALGHLYYADGNGDVVKRYTPGERESLPVVTGLTRDQIETDDGEARSLLRSAIDFLDEVTKKFGTRAPKIAEVHLDPALGLSFVEADDDLMVVVGHPPFDAALDRLSRVKTHLKDKHVKATRIMLNGSRRKDRAVARLASANP
jgi:cell division protein FtsQ